MPKNYIFHEEQKIQLFLRIHSPYWTEAFHQAIRVGIIRDGIFYRPTDIDASLMYCMGCEL